MESKAADPEPEAVARELLAGPKGGPKASPKAVASVKTALQLMAAARKKERAERAKPAVRVAKPVPAPKRTASIPMPDGVSPEMRMCNAFAAKASAAAGLTDPFAGSGARSLADMERLNQKKQEEIERLKRKAARIRAEGAKEQAEHEAYMNEEMRKEDERKKKQKRDAALKRAGCLVDRLRNASSRK